MRFRSGLHSRTWNMVKRSWSRSLSDQIHIDRSRLYDQVPEYTGSFTTPLEQEIYRTVSIFGPMTIANYMKRALLHPTMGYYTNKDVFGVKGDFTTSPEISQVFGEMIGVWMTIVFNALQPADRVSLVELGPGRGTMMSDIIRTMIKLGVKPEVHLVEQSPILKQYQSTALDRFIRDRNLHVQWHDHLSSFIPKPNVPVMFVAQEFLDALPIHQFQYTDQGWRERLVAPNLNPSSNHALQIVLAPQPTPACQLIKKVIPARSPRIGDVLEISPDSIATIDRICNHLVSNRGAALIIDYGSDHPPAETLRAVDSHKFAPFLQRPGRVDITADVNFGALRDAAVQCRQGTVQITSTVEQGRFLQSLGIMKRVEQLVDQCPSEQEQDLLIAGYERLVDPEQMGSVYKCMAIGSQDIYNQIPGFS